MIPTEENWSIRQKKKSLNAFSSTINLSRIVSLYFNLRRANTAINYKIKNFYLNLHDFCIPINILAGKPEAKSPIFKVYG